MWMGGVAASLVTGWQAFGGSFTSDFNSGPPPGTRTFGTASVDRASGVLQLTSSGDSMEGSFVIEDLDPGQGVSSFTATFKLRIGGGNGGEGFSFNLAPDIPDAPFGEEGVGLGLTVSFDTFDARNIEAPAVDVKFRGARVASARMNPRTGDEFVDVTIKVERDGTIDVLFGETAVHANLFAYTPVNGRFGFGARTSDRNDGHWIDDLSITTTILDRPFVRLATPSGPGVRPDSQIVVEVQDIATKVNPDSVELSINGVDVVPLVSKTRAVTRIEFQPTELIPSGSKNTVVVKYLDEETPPAAATADFEFTVEPYVQVPASFALPNGVVDTTQPGFNIRTVQARVDAGLAPTVARAEAQLGGSLMDPTTQSPFLNEAIPGENPDGTFDEPGVINFEKDGNPGGNFLDNDRLIPGIPGSGGHTVNAAMEILTFLEIPAGFHKFGVSSDDGFRFSIGERDARGFFSPTLGQFDGARSVDDTVFSFLTDSDGIYSVRVVWFQSGGGGSIEFFSVLEDGTRVLINDTQNANAIKAYRARVPGFPTLPLVQSVVPAPNATGVGRRPQVELSIQDGESQVAQASVELSLNGQPVSAEVNQADGITSVAFRPAEDLEPGVAYTLGLGFTDDATPPNDFKHDWIFETAREARVTGQWDFENGDLVPTFGLPMEYGGGIDGNVRSLTEFGSTTDFGVPDIGGASVQVLKYNREEPPEGGALPAGFQPGYLLPHSIGPNGGGTRVNEWTLLMDVLFSDPQVDPFSSLIQTDGPDTNGDLFVRWNNIGGEGTGGMGLSGLFSGNPLAALKIGEWHRIAVAVDTASATPGISTFVDGVKYQDLALAAPQLDGRHALGSSVHIFADNNNELNTVYVNSVQILDGKLTDDEIAGLGVATAAGLPAPKVPSDAPELGVQLSGTSVTVSWSVDFVGYALETAQDLSGSEWTLVDGVANNSITVELGDVTRFFRLQKPE